MSSASIETDHPSTLITSSLAELLRLTRERAALSQRELARRLDISRITIREAERGRDPRHSTIRQYVRAFPTLSPSALLPEGAHRIPPSCTLTWRYLRDVQGVVVTRLRRTVDLRATPTPERTLEFTGVRHSGVDLRDERARTDLMRTVLQGSLKASRELLSSARDRASGTTTIEDGDLLHEFRCSRDVNRRGINYVRRERGGSTELPDELDALACLGLGTFVSLIHSVQRLEIVVRFGDQVPIASPRLVAWPERLVPASGVPDLAPGLHPEGAGIEKSRDGRTWKLTVEHPLIGLCYALGWDGTAGGARKLTRPANTLSLVLQRERERAGLSLRGLAERMHVSPMTVAEAERGRDVRHSTLSRYLRALPDLSPWALLPAEKQADTSREATWEYYRDLFGCEAEEESKTVVISSAGHSKIILGTEGLRRLRHVPGDFRVRLGLGRSVLQQSRASLRAIEGGNEDASAALRISQVPGPDERALHQLTIPEALANTGVSFGRRLVHAGVFTMTHALARSRVEFDGPFHEGVSFGPVVPTRRLRLVTRFPRGYWPEDLRAHAWAIPQVPDPLHDDLSPRLHPEGLEIDVNRRRRNVTLVVDWPLVGFKYALSWRLP